MIKTLIRGIYKLIRPKNKYPIILTFKKEDGLWYVDLPSYPGPKAALMMVAGADDLCDYLSDYMSEVTVRLNIEPSSDDTGKFVLDEDKPCGSGAVYHYAHWGKHPLSDGTYEYYIRPVFAIDFWLCDVTLYVLGEFPKTIYFKKL